MHKRKQSVSYLSPVVIHVRVVFVDLCCHVEVLCGEDRLLLLHVHAPPLDQSVGPELQHSERKLQAAASCCLQTIRWNKKKL